MECLGQREAPETCADDQDAGFGIQHRRRATGPARWGERSLSDPDPLFRMARRLRPVGLSSRSEAQHVHRRVGPGSAVMEMMMRRRRSCPLHRLCASISSIKLTISQYKNLTH